MKRWKAFMLVLCFTNTSFLFAATNSWKGSSGDWDFQNNWSLHKRPASDQDVVITNTGTLSVTLDDASHGGSLTVLSLTLSNESGESTLLITNRSSNTGLLTLTVLHDIQFGAGSVLELVDGSASKAGVQLQSSNFFNNSAIVIITNSVLGITNRLSIGTGSNQIGTLTTAGGIVSARTVSLGDSSGAQGMWTLLDGTNFVDQMLQIGSEGGTGVVNRQGGVLIVGGTSSDYSLSIAGSIDSTGSMVLANGQVTFDSMAAGERGLGCLVISNGLLQAHDIQVGLQSSSHGRFDLIGGTTALASLGIGTYPGATGEVWMTGGLLQTTSYSHFGEFGGTGEFTISNGTVNVLGFVIADAGGAVGTMTVAGGSITASSLELSRGGRGYFWQSGGGLTVGGRISLFSPAADLICSGGVLHASDVEFRPTSPTNLLWSVAGGTSTVDNTVTITGGGTFRVSGGQVQIGRMLNIGGLAYLQVSTSTVEVAGGSLTIGNGGSLTMIGSFEAGQMVVSSGTFTTGAILMGANNSSTGLLTVSGGVAQSSVAWLGGASGALGKLTVAGGVADIGSASFGQGLFLGYSSNSTGTVAVTGGKLRVNTMTVGESGFGNCQVSSNASFDIFSLRVANQPGSVGFASFQGGTLSAFFTRQISIMEIGRLAGATGTVWITDGALKVGQNFGCFGGGALVGEQGSGRLSATSSVLDISPLIVGAKGTAEFINCQLAVGAFGCPTINSNVMLFVNSTGSFASSVQNPGTITASGSTLSFFGSVNNSGSIIATNGTVQFLGGISNSGNIVFGQDQFFVTSTACSNNDVVVSWRAFGGNRYRVQAATNFPASYNDISPEILAAGNGFSLTNYVDVGAVTNFPSRIYCVRQEF